MQAGKLRHRVTIQGRTDTQDATGQPVPAWSTFATVQAAVEPINGREMLRSQQAIGTISHRVRIRYLSGLTVRHRILWGSRVLNIQAVINPDERNIAQELLCVETV